MKNTLVIAFFATLMLTACSKSGIDDNSNATGTANVVDQSAVPQAARTALATNFSGATEVEWQRHSSSSFEAQFNHSNSRHSAGFDDSGHQSSHSILCTDGPVPQVVLDAFRQRFPTDNVYEWKLRNDGTWKAHFMRGADKYEATYTTAGVLLKFEKSS
jgi:major membrane immunogen (membrane-anchored lipoprotein)